MNHNGSTRILFEIFLIRCDIAHKLWYACLHYVWNQFALCLIRVCTILYISSSNILRPLSKLVEDWVDVVKPFTSTGRTVPPLPSLKSWHYFSAAATSTSLRKIFKNLAIIPRRSVRDKSEGWRTYRVRSVIGVSLASPYEDEAISGWVHCGLLLAVVALRLRACCFC